MAGEDHRHIRLCVRDCDGNGSITGEAGMSGVTVTLKSTNGVVLGTKSTDATGAYMFAALNPGIYVVVVTPPANYLESADPDGVKDNLTSVSLTTCMNKTGVNFGYAGTVPLVSITQTGPSIAKPGDTITFTFAVTNKGNTCFYGMEVQDTLLGGQIYNQSVSPGQGVVFSKTYVVKSTDPSTLVSAATAIGHAPAVSAATASSSVSVMVLSVPGGLVATAGNKTVSLAWNGVANATPYNVKRSTSPADRSLSFSRVWLLSPSTIRMS